MNFLVVQRILGLLLMLFSLTMLPPLGVSLYFADGNWQPFFDAMRSTMLAEGCIDRADYDRFLLTDDVDEVLHRLAWCPSMPATRQGRASRAWTEL